RTICRAAPSGTVGVTGPVPALFSRRISSPACRRPRPAGTMVVGVDRGPPPTFLSPGTTMGRRRSIQGSRILITGASQGIGRALAESAALRGAKVLAAARSPELLHELAEQVRSRGVTL